MKHLPFDRPGRFWRGNLHTHSTLSDGRRTPEQACAYYRQAGYDFVAITDHFLEQHAFTIADTRPYRTSGFTTLIGAELHAGNTEFGELWHLLAVGLPLDFPPPAPGETGPLLAARARQAGAFVAVAHPAWYSLSEADVQALGSVDAIEVYNGVSADYNDRPDSWNTMDVLLSRGLRYFACATDDAHFSPARHDTLRGWVMVRSAELTPEALLSALKAGHYYSSTGPEIYDIQVVPGKSIFVRCSPASRIFVTGISWRAASVYGPGITEAELSLEGISSPFYRVTVRDAHQGRAWSNPIWLDSE